MRTPLAVCAALVVILGFVSGKLWFQLRSDRQLIADMRAQMAQGKFSNPAQVQAPHPPPVAVATEPSIAVQTLETGPAPPVVQPAGATSSVLPAEPANRYPPPAAAMAQSDQSAIARVLAWKNSLEIAGQTLTTEQLQALNAAATAQVRRETQDNLDLQNTSRPTDPQIVFRMKEEALDRQNETNLRILRVVIPQLTEEQAKALRAKMDAGHAERLKSLQAEREQAVNAGR